MELGLIKEDKKGNLVQDVPQLEADPDVSTLSIRNFNRSMIDLGKSAIEEMSVAAPRFTIAGQGWQRYPELLAANKTWIGEQSDAFFPRAAYLLALSEISAAIDPIAIQPAYLRQKVAEPARAE